MLNVDTVLGNSLLVPAGILPGARAVNLSNFTGHLSLIPGDELKQNFSSPLLTVNELMFLFVANAGNAKGDNRVLVSKVAINALDIHSPYLQQRPFHLDSQARHRCQQRSPWLREHGHGQSKSSDTSV